MKKLIAIIGKTSSGKDALFKGIINDYPLLNPIIHYTTRPKRPKEEDGKDYWFITESDFLNKKSKNEFYSITTFKENWHYCIAADSFSTEKINIGVFNLAELRALIESQNFEIYIIEVAASEMVRKTRYLSRLLKPTPEELNEFERRFVADEEDFKMLTDIPHQRLYTDYTGSDFYNHGFISGLLYSIGYTCFF